MNKKLFIYIIAITFLITLVFICIKLNIKREDYDKERIVFLGDSITSRYDLSKYYKRYNVVNSGIGGNQTTDILNDLDNRVYRYNPTKVFLLIGTNDLVYSNMTNDGIKDNIDKIINNIHEKYPDCKIYLESIYPINDSVNKEIVETRTNTSIKDLNSKIKNICNDSKCTYINMYDKLTDRNGNLIRIYTVDGLHLNRLGYIKITKELRKYVKER